MSPDKQNGVSERRSLIVIAMLIAVGPFSMEAYLPAIPTIASELDASIVQVNLTISIFLIGAALGELFGGAISDQIGRKTNVLIGLSVYSLASLGIVFCHDIQSLQALRIIQALGCGFSAIVGMPALRDMFDPETTARKMPLIVSAMMIAPLCAPIAGSLLMLWDWRAIFGFLSIVGLFVMILFVRSVNSRKGNWRTLSFRGIASQYHRVVTFKAHNKYVALQYLFLQGFVAGVFLTFITNAAWIYIEYYSLPAFLIPAVLGVHTGAVLISNLTISRLIKTIDARVLMKWGSVIQAISTLVLLGLAWTDSVPLLLFTVLLWPAVFGAAIVNTALRAMLYGYFDFLTGSVTSLLSLARYMFGAMMGFASAMLFDNTLLPIAAIMFSGAFIGFIIISTMLPRHSLSEISQLERAEGI